jgi:hypothetical protein
MGPLLIPTGQVLLCPYPVSTEAYIISFQAFKASNLFTVRLSLVIQIIRLKSVSSCELDSDTMMLPLRRTKGVWRSGRHGEDTTGE